MSNSFSDDKGGGRSSSLSNAANKSLKKFTQNLKVIGNMRQLLRLQNTRTALLFDAYILLKYLPVGIFNKFQQLSAVYFSAEGSSSSPSSASATPSTPDTSASNAADKPSSPSQGDKSPKKKPIIILPASPAGGAVEATVKTTATPIPPSASASSSSVLKTVIEMNSQNNRVIEAKKLSELIEQKAQATSLGPTPFEEGSESVEPDLHLAADGAAAKFLETNLYWQNVESRTKYLVNAVQKSCNASGSSKANLVNNLEELFAHIYQHHETRNTAVEGGAIKILLRVMKHHPDSFIVHKTREILALLGNNPPTKGKGIKILAIDGGGVRGLVALEVLRALERVTGKRTYQLFDYICGVSTGSILAFLLGAHKKTLDEAEQLYKELSQQIFSQNSFFGSAALLWSHSYYHTPTFEKILKKHCGELPLISLARDPELPRVSAISTVVNQERVCPYVFRTYAIPPGVRAKYLGGCRYHMWEAVRASAAAPTYFEEIKLGNYLHQDGGVLCNNPTSVAISEAKTIWKDVPLQCVVSLGTGLTLSNRSDKHLNDLIEQGKEGVSYLSWKGKFLKVLDSATDTESVHNTLNELIPHSIYFRLNPYLSEVVRLDEADPKKLEQVQLETRAYLERNVAKVQFACNTLLKEKGVSKKVVDWWYHS